MDKQYSLRFWVSLTVLLTVAFVAMVYNSQISLDNDGSASVVLTYGPEGDSPEDSGPSSLCVEGISFQGEPCVSMELTKPDITSILDMIEETLDDSLDQVYQIRLELITELAKIDIQVDGHYSTARVFKIPIAGLEHYQISGNHGDSQGPTEFSYLFQRVRDVALVAITNRRLDLDSNWGNPVDLWDADSEFSQATLWVWTRPLPDEPLRPRYPY